MDWGDLQDLKVDMVVVGKQSCESVEDKKRSFQVWKSP